MGYAERAPRVFTADEYLTIERDSPYKSEFFDGAIITMSGATENHNTINVNLTAAIRIPGRARPELWTLGGPLPPAHR